MKNTTQTTLTMEMQPKSIQKTCKTLSSSLEDFLVKLSVLLENEEDLTKQEELSFLKLQGFSKTKHQNIFYSKMLKAYYLMRGGETLQTIFRVCDELRYDVSWAIYNSKDYGVPQNRERIFIKGYFRGKCGGKVLSIPRVNKSVDEPISNTYYGVRTGRVHKEDEIMNTLSCSGHNGGSSQLIQLNNDKPRPQGQRIYDDNGLAVTLNAAANNNWYKINKVGNVRPGGNQGGMVYSTNGISLCQMAGQYKDPIKIVIDNPKKVYGSFQSHRAETDGTYSPCLTSMAESNTNRPMVEFEDMTVRKLTPVECERLQGFPDNWTKYGKDDELISDTQRYKCCGNAVTTNVITAIVDEMFNGE